MKKYYFNTILLLYFVTNISAVTVKILRVENCSSSNKSIQIDKCEGFDSSVTLILNVHRPLNKLNVRNFYEKQSQKSLNVN